MDNTTPDLSEYANFSLGRIWIMLAAQRALSRVTTDNTAATDTLAARLAPEDAAALARVAALIQTTFDRRV
jgi:ABC-type xylose transport system substrate-binding protein